MSKHMIIKAAVEDMILRLIKLREELGLFDGECLPDDLQSMKEDLHSMNERVIKAEMKRLGEKK